VASNTSGPTITYRPDIDGLRAVAVLSVLFFHARLGCPGGYVGVDIFFVISGFLISALVIQELETNRFRALEFWERRVRRIVPALSVTVLLTIIASWYCYLPSDFEKFGRSVVAQGLIISNMFHWRSISYFTPSTEAFPLLHTWSLAVEEQFYLVLPVVFVFVRRWCWGGLRALLGVAGFASLAIGVWMTQTRPDAAFYLLPARAWELLIGSILAACPTWGNRASTSVRECVGWTGLLTVLGTIAAYDESIVFPGLAALPPTLGTAAIIWANRDGLTSTGRILSIRPALFVGKISYSLYLLHWPVFAMADYWFRDEMGPVTRLGLLAGVCLLSVASWWIVETPIRKKSLLASRWSLFTTAGVVTLALMATGLIIARGMIPHRFTAEELKYLPDATEKTYQEAEIRYEAALRGDLYEFGDQKGTQSLLVWGDSHAMSMIPPIAAFCEEHGVRGYAGTYSNTPPLLDFVASTRFGMKARTPTFNAAIIESALRHKVQTVILVGAWNKYASVPQFEIALERTVGRVREAGVSVVLVQDVPHHHGDVPRLLTRAHLLGRDPGQVGVTLEEHRGLNAKADLAIQRQAAVGVQVFDPTSLFVDKSGLCRAELYGIPLYRDPGHLTNAGALRLRRELDKVLQDAMGLNDSQPVPNH
jgi:peptidoglycan/LPS O-acetylase OafA/YrhL